MKELSRKDYDEQLEPLQIELARIARWVAAREQRILILFEGRDTAGKGGVIATISDYLNPRQCRITALPKPTEREAAQWYFQRHVAHLPAAGEIALFDRSWYNRAGVEKVMGYASDKQVASFLKQAPVFERMLVDDGILLFKYWLCTDQAEQEKRFAERHADPLKRWKLSPVDIEARKLYDDYTQAREKMLKATHKRHAPWTLVDFNDQRLGRLTLIRDLIQRLPKSRIEDVAPALEALKRKPHKEHYGVIEPLKVPKDLRPTAG
ncbi:polyphosphate kinase 2 [Xylophilus rhododendri]|uniref:ADP/GDP-polyphosphate phosphotransferase n=1 Tax=Xylophilus rhododendri TaxID=2697032 RepID=A0A857JC95_9BURK|nr:polyphosphate kinase 2 [Xylophilus rhododendri]QHJ00316.1 polyphosphate kinase 2 [Xylophilus rhododendri]